MGLLCLAWLIPGLVGHDPWKPDEAYNFGVVFEMLRGGSWIAPTLAGEPFLREPPLYYLTSALSGMLFSPPLALHDAARLATGFWMALALVFCGLSSRQLIGPGAGALATAILLGSFGLVLRSHQLVPQVAGLAGFAMAYYGWARAVSGPAGGLWLGTGLGIVFLSQGIPETAVVALIAGLMPLVSSTWRTRAYALTLGVALLAEFVERAARVLGDGWDVEIVEAHHSQKKDAPSGTALLLADAVKRGRGGESAEERGRDGTGLVRQPGAIGFAAIRGGTVAGDHDVMFLGHGERIILSHRAESRAIFARGALVAARFLIGKPAGLYSMRDVIEAG